MEAKYYTGLYNEAVKKIKDTDIKNPINHELIKKAFETRPKNLHKGSCGSLIIIGGSPGLTGAPVMSALAALKTGCGLICLICQKDLNPIFEIKLTEPMTYPVATNGKSIAYRAWRKILDKTKNFDAILIGPGISRERAVERLCEKILLNTKGRLVIDADGLYAIKDNLAILKKLQNKPILTPHIGEFAYLTGFAGEYILKNQATLCLEFAAENNCILVLKSHQTTVSDGKRVYQNVLGNPGMATGGSGDVLSGIIASLLSQGSSPLQAALSGVYIHSLSADMASLCVGEYSLTPGDMIEYISYAINETSKREL